MSKILYAYFNNKDLYDFFEFIENQRIPIIAKSRSSIKELQAISTDLSTLYIPTCESNNIEITMCHYAGYFLQPGSIRIDEVLTSQDKNVFTTIKKYIHKRYKLSKDKSYYIGPGIYSDWLNRIQKFPVLFEYDEITVFEQDIKDVFASISKKGFVIRANNVRLRSINDWTFDDESFVIFDSINKLSKVIFRKTIVHYDYESICIFVYKDSKRKRYKFILDKRIDEVTENKLIELYEGIRTQYE